jgi:hypothetical protein
MLPLRRAETDHPVPDRVHEVASPPMYRFIEPPGCVDVTSLELAPRGVTTAITPALFSEL